VKVLLFAGVFVPYLSGCTSKKDLCLVSDHIVHGSNKATIFFWQKYVYNISLAIVYNTLANQGFIRGRGDISFPLRMKFLSPTLSLTKYIVLSS